MTELQAGSHHRFWRGLSLLLGLLGAAGCISIPKPDLATCPRAHETAARAQRDRTGGSVALAFGIPIAIGAGVTAVAAATSASAAATVNPSYVIRRPNGTSVNSAQRYSSLSTGLAIASGVSTGLSIGLNVGGGVGIGVARLKAGLAERQVASCAETGGASLVIARVIERGEWLVLSDESVLRIDSDSVPTVSNWSAGDLIAVSDGLLYNLSREEGARLKKRSTP